MFGQLNNRESLRYLILALETHQEKDPALLDKNTSHYIAIPEDNSYCYLLKSKRPRDIDGSIKIK